MLGNYENGNAGCLLPLQIIQRFGPQYSVSETVTEFALSEINLCLFSLRLNVCNCVPGRWGQDVSDFSKPVFGSKIHSGKKMVIAFQGIKAVFRY